MKTKLLALCVTLIGVGAPAPAFAQEAGPGEVVEVLFQAMKAGDADAMAALMHPEVRLMSTQIRDGVPTVQMFPVEAWLTSVRNSPRELDERLHGMEVRSEDAVASVWTRYDLYVDGVVNHCGIDAFHLVKTESGWRILEVVDTHRTEGCGRS